MILERRIILLERDANIKYLKHLCMKVFASHQLILKMKVDKKLHFASQVRLLEQKKQ